jgi:F-type H+-transporting ATPase subunit gamma
MSLKAIKNKIKSVDKTKKVTKAMGSVAAVKMRKSQMQAIVSRPYSRQAMSILKRLSGLESVEHPLLFVRPVVKTGVIVITSDKGLAGNLNNAVIKSVVKVMTERDLDNKNTSLICIGKKGYEYFSKRGFHIEKYYAELGSKVSSDGVVLVTQRLVKLYTSKKFDAFLISYTNFISTTNQKAITRDILPISFEEVKRIIDDIVPDKGKFADIEKKDLQTEEVREYIFEPNPEALLKELLPFLLNIQIYYSLLEAQAAEHSARMVAMKNASDKADDISKALNLKFNKARQATITGELNEIVSGMESLT